MNRFASASVFLAALGLAAFAPTNVRAHGLLRGCGHSCGVECAPVVVCAPPAPVYEDRKVIRYKTVTKERDVVETVYKLVTREEKYNYTVCVPQIRQEKRQYTVNVPHHKQVEYKYTVLVPQTYKEKRTVVECVPSYKDVEYVYTVCVPQHVKKVVKQTYYERRVSYVDHDVTVCRMSYSSHVDECGRCYTTCHPVTEVVKVKRCVVDCVPVVRDVEVVECNYTHEQRKGVRRVCEIVRNERVIDVDVVRCVAQERVGQRTVCEYVAEQREHVVNVCHYVNEERVGVRHVCDRVAEQVKRKVVYHECVAYEEVVRVQVNHCYSDCGHRRCGFFRCCH
jgi:hypothetical protein